MPQHLQDGNLPPAFPRPAILPELTANDFCKGRLSDSEGRHCYTGWLLEIFLDGDNPYVEAYKEFRLKTMDLMYQHYNDDHARTPTQRAELFCRCATELGYTLAPRTTPSPVGD